MLMLKKTDSGDHYIFFFFLNHVLYKAERTLGKPTGRTLKIFLFKLMMYYIVIECFKNANLH